MKVLLGWCITRHHPKCRVEVYAPNGTPITCTCSCHQEES